MATFTITTYLWWRGHRPAWLRGSWNLKDAWECLDVARGRMPLATICGVNWRRESEWVRFGKFSTSHSDWVTEVPDPIDLILESTRRYSQARNNFQPPVPPGTLIGHMCEIPEIPER